MSGNTRGKLKEHFEGMHRGFDWVKHHCIQSLTLIADQNPKLSEAITALAMQVDTLDGLTNDIYSTI